MFCLVFQINCGAQISFQQRGHSAEPAKHQDSETSAVQRLGRKTVASPHGQAARVVGLIFNLCFPQKDSEARGNAQLALKNAGLNSAGSLIQTSFSINSLPFPPLGFLLHLTQLLSQNHSQVFCYGTPHAGPHYISIRMERLC